MKAYVFNFFGFVIFGFTTIALIFFPVWGIGFDVFHSIALILCVFLFFLFWWASIIPVNRFNISTLPSDFMEEENVGGMLRVGGQSPIDVVILFAYGKGEKMNAILGGWANNIVDTFGSPNRRRINLYTQLDMTPFVETIQISFAHEGKKYLSTYGIVKQFSEAVKDRGYHRVAVIAAPQHIKRCVRDLYAEGFSCYVDTGKFFLPKGASLEDESFWYNPDDPQDQVRSHKNWWRRERILRILPFVLYKILAR